MFGLMTIKYTSTVLNKQTALENGLCALFASDARRQLHCMFTQFGKGVHTACQLHNAVCSQFFDNV